MLDNNIFTGINNVNRVNINALSDILEFEEEQEKNADIKFMVGNVLAIGVFIFIALFYLIFTIICYRKYDKEFESEFYNEYYRELPASYPPAVMGYLYKFREIDDNDLTATLLDLIRRKYLILDTNSNSVNEKNPNYTILLNKEKSQNNLTNSERFLIKWFINEIGDGTKVSSLQLNSYCDELWGAQQYRESSKQWYKLVKVEAKKYNFFDENIHKPKKFFVIFSILIGALAFFSLWFISSYSKYSLGIHLSFGILFLTLAFITYVNSFDRRSKSGNEDYVRWRAFNKFLEDFSSFEDYPVPSLIIWEHYLVYATSFGIADKVMEQLKLKLDLSYVNTFDSTFVIYFGFNHRIGGFNHMVRGMRSSAMSTITKRNAQRGGGFSSGGGGGFSGGSSFGGGGGSFGGGRR